VHLAATASIRGAADLIAAVPATVSVVVPAYNHADFLSSAIDSLLAQNYPNLEIIVLDDGSTDHTSAVLENYRGKVHCESQANIGQAATLNKGWGMARGDILGYLSADDMLAPDAVSKAALALSANPLAVAVYPDFNLIDPNSVTVRTVRAPDFEFCRALLGNECLPGPGAFFRRSALQLAGGWNPAFRQMPDYDFWLRLGLHGEFVHLKEALASFRVHPGSQTYGMVSPPRAEEPVTIISSILDDQRLPAAAAALRNQALANAHLFSAQLHLRAGRFGEGWQKLKVAHSLNTDSVLSLRGMRVLANALLNRVGHRLLWSVRHCFRLGKPTKQ